MENLIEICKNTVALLMIMRIAVFVGVVLVILRVGYSLFSSPNFTRFWNDRKRGFTRYRNLIKHDLE